MPSEIEFGTDARRMHDRFRYTHERRLADRPPVP
jgi:pyridoxine/pyridoxamine 5'-phosphate oxidase